MHFSCHRSASVLSFITQHIITEVKLVTIENHDNGFDSKLLQITSLVMQLYYIYMYTGITAQLLLHRLSVFT